MATRNLLIISLLITLAIISNLNPVKAGFYYYFPPAESPVTIEQASNEYQCVLQRKPTAGQEVLSLSKVTERIGCNMAYNNKTSS